MVSFIIVIVNSKKKLLYNNADPAFAFFVMEEI